ncbi:uncharacterized protein LOC129045653 isoform X1 [Mirounga angustirostris]|uniref:uncharacterized protein LOC129045653 isoform X1 n=1 Tax=Mirounga angustirostris TaxID=9716 RepID=UPI00313C8FF7
MKSFKGRDTEGRVWSVPNAKLPLPSLSMESGCITLPVLTWGSGLTPSVGSAGSEGTRLQALLHQPPMSSPRVGWAVHLLIQKQNLDALGLTQEMPARPNLCPLCYLATSGPSRVEDYDSPALTPDHAVPPDRCPWAKSRLEGVRRRPRIGNEREAWVAKEAEENMSQQGCTAARTSLIHLPFPRRSAILDIALIWTITSILKPEEEKKGKALSFQAHHEEGAHIFSIHIPWASTLSMDIPRCKGVWEMWS